MEILDDQNLEALGYIKQVDTLKILRQAQDIKAKRQKKWIIALAISVFSVCILAQLLYFSLFGFKIIWFMLGGVYLMLGSIFMMMVLMKGER